MARFRKSGPKSSFKILQVNLYFMAAGAGADDTVDDRLVVDDLRGRDRGFAAGSDRIDEGLHLLQEEVRLIVLDQRDLGGGRSAEDVVHQGHFADGTIHAPPQTS